MRRLVCVFVFCSPWRQGFSPRGPFLYVIIRCNFVCKNVKKINGAGCVGIFKTHCFFWLLYFVNKPLINMNNKKSAYLLCFLTPKDIGSHFIQASLSTSVICWKSLDPDQARQNVRLDLDPNCLTIYWYSLNTFSKKWLEKNSRRLKAWKIT